MVENRMKKGGFKTINVNILIASVFANTFLKYIEGFSDYENNRSGDKSSTE